MVRITRFVVSLAVVVGVLSVGGCIIVNGESNWDRQAKFERTVELQHEMPAGATLVATTGSGSIVAAGQDTDRAAVVAKIQARAATEEEAQELAEAVEISFQQAGDRLTLKANKPSRLGWRRSISISYDIIVPRRSHIECESGSGSVQVQDLTGNVKARAGSGSAEAARIEGAVYLHSGSGSIRCEEVRGGDLDLNTGSGGVRLSHATEIGTCRAHSSSGSVRVQHLQAESVRLDTGSGGVTAEDLHCTRLHANSGSGNVSVTFAPAAPSNVMADLGTGSGNVTAVMPAGFAGRVELSTGSGSVRIDLPVLVRGEIGRRRITGTIGEGTGHLTARTGSGSLNVR